MNTILHRPGLTYLLIFFMPVLMQGGQNAAAAEEKLPRLELPEYVISGVEQATRLTAEKIPLETRPQVELVAPVFIPRMELSCLIPDFIPGKPQFSPVEGKDYLRGGIFTGSFRSGELQIECASNLIGLETTSQLNLKQHPQRTKVGWDNSRLFDISLAGSQPWGLWFSGFSLIHSNYKFKDINNHSTTSWNSGNAQLSLTPLTTRFGRWEFSAEGSLWKYQGIEETSLQSGRLFISNTRDLKSGRLDNEIELTGENVVKEKGDVGLINWQSRYYRNALPNLGYFVGLGFYSAQSCAAKSYQGLRLQGGMEYQPVKNGIFTLLWTPDNEIERRSDWFDRYPQLAPSACGSAVETTSRLSAAYRHYIRTNLTANIRLEYNRCRHQPFLVQNTSANLDTSWTLNNGSFRSLCNELSLLWSITPEFEFDLNITLQNSKHTSDIKGNHAPDITPFKAGTKGQFRLFNCNWSSGLQYFSKTPLTSDGQISRAEYWEFNISAARSIAPVWSLEVGLDNALNQHWQELPGYDAPPLTLWLGLHYGARLTNRNSFTSSHFIL